MKEVSDSLKKLTKNQLTKEDVAKQVTAAVNTAIDLKVTKRFNRIDARQDKTEERLAKLEKEREESPGAGMHGSLPEYLIARRSVRILPCQATREGVDKFLRKELDMPKEAVKNISVVHLREITEKNLPLHRARESKNKIELKLETIDDRDIIMSYASNLSGGSNIYIAVPDKLRPLQVRLEHFAYKYRKCQKLGLQAGRTWKPRLKSG